MVYKDAELCLHGHGILVTACGYNPPLLALHWVPLSWSHNHHALHCSVHQSHPWQGKFVDVAFQCIPQYNQFCLRQGKLIDAVLLFTSLSYLLKTGEKIRGT